MAITPPPPTPTGFIAERDGPDLVAFAKLDPPEHTQYLERYIEIHAANRYVHYRNHSLWMLLQPMLEFPDAAWVRQLVQRLVDRGAHGDQRRIRGIRCPSPSAPCGRTAAIALAGGRARTTRASSCLDDTAALRPDEGRTDSWSHYHRRASALAEGCRDRARPDRRGRGSSAGSRASCRRGSPASARSPR